MKILLVEEFGSNDADFSLKLMGKSTDGMDIRYMETMLSDFYLAGVHCF